MAEPSNLDQRVRQILQNLEQQPPPPTPSSRPNLYFLLDYLKKHATEKPER